jgi:hypothetical protein
LPDQSEELVLAGRGTQAQQPRGTLAGVAEPVGGVGRHVDGLPSSRRDALTAEGHLDLAVEDREHLLEVVAVRRGTASWRDVHVDQRVPTVGVAAGDQDRVGVAHQAQVRQAVVLVGSGDGQAAGRIVRWDRWWRRVRWIVCHGVSFLY